MNGVHDMGGMHGFGPIVVERDEPVYHEKWEAHVHAMMRRTVDRCFSLDEFRNAVEHMPPARYLEATYYERWLTAVETLLVDKGLIRREELDGRLRGERVPVVPAPSGVEPARPETRSGKPRFVLGEPVVTKQINPAGHTRIPRYARGKQGVVASVKGPYLLPDTNAHRLSRDWQPVYAVRFDARELWGEQATANTSVCVDLWESYLEPVREAKA